MFELLYAVTRSMSLEVVAVVGHVEDELLMTGDAGRRQHTAFGLEWYCVSSPGR